MKRHLIIALILLTTLPGMAQVASIKTRHGGGSHQQNTSLTVAAPRHQTFWLYVDDVLQNEQPVRSICIRNLWNDNFYIRVELNNAEHHCVGQFVDMTQSQTLNIVEKNKFYGLQHTQGQVRPELTMNLVTSQPYVAQGNHNVVPVPSAPPTPQCMSQHDYDEAYHLISNEPYDNTKLTMAKQVAANNLMTVKQIANICKLFSFENNKLEFAKYAYRFCTEKNKYYLMNEVFSYDSSKHELNEYIQGQ